MYQRGNHMNILNELKSPYDLLEYMNSNITYGFVGKNGKKYSNMYSEEWNDWYKVYYLQNGEDVLKSNVGICWDQVELERLWFEKNNYSFKTFFIIFEVDRKNDLPSHTFLIYEKDNKYYWFEHSFDQYKGITEFNSEEEAVKFVMNKQYEFVSNGEYDLRPGDYEKLKVYVYSKPNYHIGVDDYLKFVTKEKYNNN